MRKHEYILSWTELAGQIQNWLKTKILVSKETVVLRRWEIETEIYFIKWVDKGQTSW